MEVCSGVRYSTQSGAEVGPCENTISPYLINVSHSQIDLLWKKAHRASVYCLCRGSVADAGFTADFEGCDGGAHWLCLETLAGEAAALSAALLEPATEYVFCARRHCDQGGYSQNAECARVRSAEKPGAYSTHATSASTTHEVPQLHGEY